MARPLVRASRRLLAVARGISVGDLDQDVDIKVAGELGATADAFGDMVAYLREMEQAGERIADGDLTADIEPKSEHDALGHALGRMTVNLREMIGEVVATATTVSTSSDAVTRTSDESGRAVAEIAGAMTEITSGAEAQLRMVSSATRSAAEMSPGRRRVRRRRPPVRRRRARGARAGPRGRRGRDPGHDGDERRARLLPLGLGGDVRPGGQVGPDRLDRPAHHRDRRADEPARAQRRHRGRARGRERQGLRGRRRGGPPPGRERRRRGARDRRPDRPRSRPRPARSSRSSPTAPRAPRRAPAPSSSPATRSSASTPRSRRCTCGSARSPTPPARSPPASETLQSDLNEVAGVAERSTAASEQVSAAAQQTTASTSEITAPSSACTGPRRSCRARLALPPDGLTTAARPDRRARLTFSGTWPSNSARAACRRMCSGVFSTSSRRCARYSVTACAITIGASSSAPHGCAPASLRARRGRARRRPRSGPRTPRRRVLARRVDDRRGTRTSSESVIWLGSSA